MAQYRFTIQYIPGEDNTLADLLSRPDGVVQKSPTTGEDNSAQGDFYSYEGMMIYRPSWVNPNVKPVHVNIDEVIPEARMILHLSTNKSFSDDKILGEMDVMAQAQGNDPILSRIIEGLRKGTELGFLNSEGHTDLARFKNRFILHPVSQLLLVARAGNSNDHKVFVPTPIRPALVYKFHNEHMHLGSNKVFELVSRIYFWPDMEADVVNFVQSCSICIARKGSAANQTPPLLHLPRPSGQWQVCYMDFISFSEPILGFKHVLTFIDGFSRFLITVPVRHESAACCAKALVNNVFLPFTPPMILSSDRGSAIKSEFLREACKIFGTEVKLHVAWRPESTGVLERVHRVLKDCIFISAFEWKISWLDASPLVTKALNVSVHKSIGVSPYEVIFGHKKQIADVPAEMRPNSNSPMSQVVITRLNLEKISRIVKKYQAQTDKMNEKSTKRSDAAQLEVGEEISLKQPRSALALEHHLNNVGPYTVTGTNGSVVRITDPDGNSDFVHRAHCCPHPKRVENFDIFPPVTLPIPPIRSVEKPREDVVIGNFNVPNSALEPEIGITEPIPAEPIIPSITRYPTRDRRIPDRLNIGSTKDKSYSGL